MKVYSDYVPKYSKQQTLKIISETKKEVMDMFNEMFGLLEVDPKVTCYVNEYYTDKRIITFDNFINNQILEFTPYINNYLIKLTKDFMFEPGNGTICYTHVVDRDINDEPNQCSFSFDICAHIKFLASEVNDIKISNLAQQIIKKLNDLNVVKEYGIPLPKKLHSTTVDKLHKQYPIIDKKLIINEVCNKFNNCLVFQTSGDNKYNLSFLEQKLAVYGQNVCTYYVYNKVSNSVLKLFTIYSVAYKDYLVQKISKLNMKIDSFDEMISGLPEISDQIGIEFHLSNYITYMLEKYSINEVVSSPLNIEYNKEQLK